MKKLQKNNFEQEKLKIINWIISINDEKLLKKIYSLKEKSNVQKSSGTRKFGFGKGTFTYISEDFDAPLEEFKDYMPRDI